MKKKLTLRTQASQGSQYNLALSRLTERNKAFYSEKEKSRIYEVGIRNKQQVLPQSFRLEIGVKKNRISSPNKQQYLETEIPKINPNKFKANLKTRTSTHSESRKLIYGITTYKGFKGKINPHHIGIFLGKLKHILFCEAYDGMEAANLVKQIFPAQLNAYSSKQIERTPEKYLLQAYQQTQSKISQHQRKINNNSGCSLTSVIIGEQLIAVGNCGASKVICSTKTGQIMNLADQHTTKNQLQLVRIFNNKGSVYQSVVEVPDEKQLKIGGPIRMSPSGLVYSRTLGRSFDFQISQKLNKSNSSLMNIPEIKYINKKQVRWFAIMSQSIAKYCQMSYIEECIQKQLLQQSQKYTAIQISQKCSTKIVEQVLRKGINQAVSIVVVIINQIKNNYNYTNPHVQPLNFGFLDDTPKFRGYQQPESYGQRHQNRKYARSKRTYSQISQSLNKKNYLVN